MSWTALKDVYRAINSSNFSSACAEDACRTCFKRCTYDWERAVTVKTGRRERRESLDGAHGRQKMTVLAVVAYSSFYGENNDGNDSETFWRGGQGNKVEVENEVENGDPGSSPARRGRV
jgi:hypothetical protein